MNVVQFKVPFPPGQSVFVQEEKGPSFYNYMHAHPEIQITCILKGSGILYAGNQNCTFNAGEAYIIGAGQPHIFKTEFRTNSQRNICNSVSVYFNPESQLKSFFDLPEIYHVKTFTSFTKCGLKIPSRFFKQIISKIQLLRSSENETVFCIFMNLLSFISRIEDLCVLDKTYNAHLIQKKYQFPISDIYNYVLNNYHENIDLATIAAIAHLSPQAFCRNFKKHTRKTFVTYLNEIRVHQACTMLRTIEGVNISSVAYNCGFNNVISFDRVFRKITGVSPSKFLKRGATA